MRQSSMRNGGRQFLIDYRDLIDYVAVSGWVRFTEQFTSAPRLHDKIAGTRVKRGAVSQWCELLRVIQNGKCFYDETHDMASSEVDHLLPWSPLLRSGTDQTSRAGTSAVTGRWSVAARMRLA